MVTGGAPGEGGDTGFVTDEEGVEGDGILLRARRRYKLVIKDVSVC